MLLFTKNRHVLLGSVVVVLMSYHPLAPSLHIPVVIPPPNTHPTRKLIFLIQLELLSDGSVNIPPPNTQRDGKLRPGFCCGLKISAPASDFCETKIYIFAQFNFT